ncbi:helix-turn-helix transcriptional regulator [Rubrimonas cliftonensis]|uniref:DNA binding domain-containing protein, excisionase family n=1 Tax=Rubrimonas cliftonensis TaxID=89524 RepID=A0A1H4AHY5_9RHOB|nr:helix-turn-helix transcriptional regulator [Rubrimonas cliftonensis]SEA35338.1 DNA binding domain-containing protein, excisionase family [Rubrimonas cliftonensis]
MEATPPEFLTTREVAALLRVRERKVYDMAAAGEIPCRRLTGKLLFPRAQIERWLGGGAAEARPAPAGAAVVAGSHDPLLEWAIRESGSGLATMFDGSLDGLDRLAEGAAVAAGLHVPEPDTGGWNVAAATGRLGASAAALIGWARRRRGLIFAAGRELGALRDVRGLRLARRQPAAGAALWLAGALEEAGLAGAVTWTEAVARTETEAAMMVAQGEADAAAGLEASARPFGLELLPLTEEAFDLAVERRAFFEPPLQTLLAFARTPAFAAKAAALGGYDLADLGSVRWNGP